MYDVLLLDAAEARLKQIDKPCIVHASYHAFMKRESGGEASFRHLSPARSYRLQPGKYTFLNPTTDNFQIGAIVIGSHQPTYVSSTGLLSAVVQTNLDQKVKIEIFDDEEEAKEGCALQLQMAVTGGTTTASTLVVRVLDLSIQLSNVLFSGGTLLAPSAIIASIKSFPRLNALAKLIVSMQFATNDVVSAMSFLHTGRIADPYSASIATIRNYMRLLDSGNFSAAFETDEALAYQHEFNFAGTISTYGGAASKLGIGWYWPEVSVLSR